jgi:hypothetical protein
MRPRGTAGAIHIALRLCAAHADHLWMSADPKSLDQRCPPCCLMSMQNVRLWTAKILIGIESTLAQNGGLASGCQPGFAQLTAWQPPGYSPTRQRPTRIFIHRRFGVKSSASAAIRTSADLVPMTESRCRHGSLVGRVASGTRVLGQGSVHVSAYLAMQRNPHADTRPEEQVRRSLNVIPGATQDCSLTQRPARRGLFNDNGIPSSGCSTSPDPYTDRRAARSAAW